MASAAEHTTNNLGAGSRVVWLQGLHPATEMNDHTMAIVRLSQEYLTVKYGEILSIYALVKSYSHFMCSPMLP